MDQRLDQSGTRASVAALKSASRELQPVAVWAIATCVAIASGIYLYNTEGGGATSFFTIAVTLTICALIVFISRRVLFALVLVAALLAVVRTTAYVKQQSTEVILHAYDLVSVLSSWSAITHLWHDHRHYAVSLLTALMATAVAGWVVYRFDGTRIPRGYVAGAAAIRDSRA